MNQLPSLQALQSRVEMKRSVKGPSNNSDVVALFTKIPLINECKSPIVPQAFGMVCLIKYRESGGVGWTTVVSSFLLNSSYLFIFKNHRLNRQILIGFKSAVEFFTLQ